MDYLNLWVKGYAITLCLFLMKMLDNMGKNIKEVENAYK